MDTVKRVVLVRQKQGLSQAKLAQKADVNPTSMCRIECGKEPAFPVRGQRIADALGWAGSVESLFEDVSVM